MSTIVSVNLCPQATDPVTSQKNSLTCIGPGIECHSGKIVVMQLSWAAAVSSRKPRGMYDDGTRYWSIVAVQKVYRAF